MSFINNLLIIMPTHTVIYGSCLDYLKHGEFPNGLQLVVTSPPYYNARDYSTYRGGYNMYLMFIKNVSQAVYDRLDNGGHFCLNLTAVTETDGGGRKLYPTSTDALQICQDIGFELIWDVAWMKPKGMPSNGGYNYNNPYPFKMYMDSWREEIWILRKGKPRRLPQELLEKSKIEPRERVKELMCREWYINPVIPATVGHPASYPLELPYRCIEMFSVMGDVVFDPFLGSGTTIEAAMKLGRNGMGTEITRKYLPVIYKRIGADQSRLTDEVKFKFLQIDQETKSVTKFPRSKFKEYEEKYADQRIENKQKRLNQKNKNMRPRNGKGIMDFAGK